MAKGAREIIKMESTAKTGYFVEEQEELHGQA